LSNHTSSDSAPTTVTAEGEAFTSDPKQLVYVDVAAPPLGTGIAVTPGVMWCRIPLPMDLDHINVWLVDTDEGCVLVDTGIAVSVGREAWENLARDVLATKPLRAIFITHIHPDHIGLAAWLQERYRVAVLMSKRTHELATFMLSSGANPPNDAEAAAFFHSHGMSEPALMAQMYRPERFARMTSGLPHVDQFVADGDTLSWGGGQWTAMETNGHAEGHLCLSNGASQVLISGDQVLPTISSNIGFTWRNADPNPLDSYISSLRRLRTLSENTLVLPSHGVPFYGLRHRVDDLIQHHQEKLAMLARFCLEARTARDVLPVMFRRELKGMHLFLALAEALAHLEYLVHAGQVERRTGADGVIRYEAH
jgi:glyoxylase-like metal-dependent hydrolase (beta-lactamase superfamily II)